MLFRDFCGVPARSAAERAIKVADVNAALDGLAAAEEQQRKVCIITGLLTR